MREFPLTIRSFPPYNQITPQQSLSHPPNSLYFCS